MNLEEKYNILVGFLEEDFANARLQNYLDERGEEITSDELIQYVD